MNGTTMATTKATKAPAVVVLDEIRSKTHKRGSQVYGGEVIEGHHAEIVVGESVTLHGIVPAGHRYVRDAQTGRMVPSARPTLYANVFRIGDEACCGSFNLVYTGVVRAITAKTITVVEYEGSRNERVYRMDIATFDRRNWDFDAAEASRRNAEWMD